MLDKELEHIDGLSTFNTDNMADQLNTSFLEVISQ